MDKSITQVRAGGFAYRQELEKGSSVNYSVKILRNAKPNQNRQCAAYTSRGANNVRLERW
jgi:hypothetical protein